MQIERYKKSLGQNFLIDNNIIAKLLLSIPQNRPIIEVGTGSGNLTIALSAHTTCPIHTYEVDSMAYEAAQERNYPNQNIIFHLEDFLKAEIPIFPEKAIVVANIPYYITSPIIDKILQLPSIEKAFLMVQKEMAHRIIAKPSTNDYSSFSIFCNTRALTKKLFDVSKNCFYPIPKVDSSYIELTPIDIHLNQIKNLISYNKIIRSAFWGKRKTLLNCLQKSPYIHFSKENLEKAYHKLNMNLLIRGQQLAIEDFILLSNELSILEQS